MKGSNSDQKAKRVNNGGKVCRLKEGDYYNLFSYKSILSKAYNVCISLKFYLCLESSTMVLKLEEEYHFRFCWLL